MTANTCYLAGPMRMKPLFNFQAFEDAMLTLRARNWSVVSPHEYDIYTRRVQAEYYTWQGRRHFVSVELAPSFDFEQTMDEDLRLISEECDSLVLLPGWGDSEGAVRELTHAMSLHYPIFLYTDGVLTPLPEPEWVTN